MVPLCFAFVSLSFNSILCTRLDFVFLEDDDVSRYQLMKRRLKKIKGFSVGGGGVF
jgi:hypothetical protein